MYSLTELNRAAVKNARILANPGCYPTAAQLPLIPLLRAGLISGGDIIINAKSGTTGAGRAPKEVLILYLSLIPSLFQTHVRFRLFPVQAFLYCEVTDGMHAYGVATHRHAPEIEQGLGDALGKSMIVNFTPHLMPMSRGIFEAIYVRLAPGKTAADCKAKLVETYKVRSIVLALLKHHA